MSDDQGRSPDDMMGGWDIGWSGKAPETRDAGSRYVYRSWSESTLASSRPTALAKLVDMCGTAQTPITEARVTWAPPKSAPIEYVRDLLTGDEYFFTQEIDNGYVLGKTAAGEEVLIGLLAWERFTR